MHSLQTLDMVFTDLNTYGSSEMQDNISICTICYCDVSNIWKKRLLYQMYIHLNYTQKLHFMLTNDVTRITKCIYCISTLFIQQ